MPPKKTKKKDLDEEEEKKEDDPTEERKRKRKEIGEEWRKVQIRELDVNKIIHPISEDDSYGGYKIVVIGGPGKGKSRLIKSIQWHKKHIIPIAQITSATEEHSATSEFPRGYFAHHNPEIFLHSSLKAEVIRDYEKRQGLAKKHLKNSWSMNIWDDSSDDKYFFKKPIVQRPYKYGRWWNMLKVLGLQYAIDIGPDIRVCIDGLFLFSESNPDIREKIFHQYIPMRKHEENQFYDILEDVTDEKGCSLYVDYRSNSSNLEDMFYFYKADIKKVDSSDWRFGADVCWKFSDERMKIFDVNNIHK